MKDKSVEAQKIVEQYAVPESRAYSYEGLPMAEYFTVLQKYPEQTTLTEKIGNTEYTVNAHFRKDGNDLMYYLSHLIFYGVNPNIYKEK